MSGMAVEIKSIRFCHFSGIGSYTDSLLPTAYYTQEDIKEV